MNALHELLDLVTSKANHPLARDLYVKLQLEALVALDCNRFFAAFEQVKGKPNPRTAFAALTSELDPDWRRSRVSAGCRSRNSHDRERRNRGIVNAETAAS